MVMPVTSAVATTTQPRFRIVERQLEPREIRVGWALSFAVQQYVPKKWFRKASWLEIASYPSLWQAENHALAELKRADPKEPVVVKEFL